MHGAGVDKGNSQACRPILADSQYSEMMSKGFTSDLQCRSSFMSSVVSIRFGQTDLRWACACALFAISWYILDLRNRG